MSIIGVTNLPFFGSSVKFYKEIYTPDPPPKNICTPGQPPKKLYTFLSHHLVSYPKVNHLKRYKNTPLVNCLKIYLSLPNHLKRYTPHLKIYTPSKAMCIPGRPEAPLDGTMSLLHASASVTLALKIIALRVIESHSVHIAADCSRKHELHAAGFCHQLQPPASLDHPASSSFTR